MFSQEELEKAGKRLEGMGITPNIDNGTLYVFINDTYLELSEFEIRYQITSYDEEQEAEENED